MGHKGKGKVEKDVKKALKPCADWGLKGLRFNDIVKKTGDLRSAINAKAKEKV